MLGNTVGIWHARSKYQRSLIWGINQMFADPSFAYNRCYISAPPGVSLGVLPILLGERAIAWNWATGSPNDLQPAIGIEQCDFLIAIFDGSRSDYRVMYEIGIAEGLKKPILAFATNKRVNSVVLSLIAAAEVGLQERTTLSFQLNAFLAKPHEDIFERSLSGPHHRSSVLPKSEPISEEYAQQSSLERRISQAIQSAGGSVVFDPPNQEKGFRPDLLIWLASQDPNFLDPAIIEITQAASSTKARKVEENLSKFMIVSGIRCGFLLTEQEPLQTFKFKSPNLFWLSVDHFVMLTSTGRLGWHVRDLRNRAIHGLL